MPVVPPARGKSLHIHHDKHTAPFAFGSSSQPISENFGLRESDKHGRQHDSTCKPKQQALHENCVLNLPQRRLLNPDLAVDDFAEGIPLLVPDHPRLVLVAVAKPKTVERALACNGNSGLVLVLEVLGEQLPGTDVAMV
jgi:hypothetical protein